MEAQGNADDFGHAIRFAGHAAAMASQPPKREGERVIQQILSKMFERVGNIFSPSDRQTMLLTIGYIGNMFLSTRGLPTPELVQLQNIRKELLDTSVDTDERMMKINAIAEKSSLNDIDRAILLQDVRNLLRIKSKDNASKSLDPDDLLTGVKPITIALDVKDYGIDWCTTKQHEFFRTLLDTEYGLTLESYQSFTVDEARVMTNFFFSSIYGMPGARNLQTIVSHIAKGKWASIANQMQSHALADKFRDVPELNLLFHHRGLSGNLSDESSSVLMRLMQDLSAKMYYEDFLRLKDAKKDSKPYRTMRLRANENLNGAALARSFIAKTENKSVDAVRRELNVARSYYRLSQYSESCLFFLPQGSRNVIREMGSTRMLAAIQVFEKIAPEYKYNLTGIGTYLYPIFSSGTQETQIELAIKSLSLSSKTVPTKSLSYINEQIVHEYGDEA